MRNIDPLPQKNNYTLYLTKPVSGLLSNLTHRLALYPVSVHRFAGFATPLSPPASLLMSAYGSLHLTVNTRGGTFHPQELFPACHTTAKAAGTPLPLAFSGFCLISGCICCSAQKITPRSPTHRAGSRRLPASHCGRWVFSEAQDPPKAVPPGPRRTPDISG